MNLNKWLCQIWIEINDCVKYELKINYCVKCELKINLAQGAIDCRSVFVAYLHSKIVVPPLFRMKIWGSSRLPCL